MRILRSERAPDTKRLKVFVSESSASDLFWLEMVLKGSRIPFALEAVADRAAARRHLQQLASNGAPPDLVLLDHFDLFPVAPLPASCFVLADKVLRSSFEECFGDPRHFMEKPFTNEKLVACLETARLDRWISRQRELVA